MQRRAFLTRLLAFAATSLSWSRQAHAEQPFSLAYLDTYRPISFREDGRPEGKMTGILIDILDEVIARRLKIPVTHHGYPWKRAQDAVQRGEHDALCATATKARLEYAVASREAALKIPFRVFVRADNRLLPTLQDARTIEELRQINPSVLSYAGNGWVAEKLAGFNVSAIGTADASLRMLDAGRGDIIVENVVTMGEWLRTTPPVHEIRMMPHTLDENEWHLLINKNSPQTRILPAFDKAMARFRREAGYIDILSRYGVRF